MSKRVWAIILMLLLITAIMVVSTRSQDKKYLNEPYQKEKVVLDTLVTIKAYGPHKAQVERAVDQAMEEIEKIDSQMDCFNPRSEVSKINKTAAKKGGGKITVSPDLMTVIAASKEYNLKTEGAFDITLRPVMRLWDFNGKAHVPSQQQLQEALALVDMNNLEINREEGTISFKKRGMALDLGGVAKGYAADRAVAVLKKHGIRRALVTTGSTTMVMDSKPNNEPWIIGVQNPRKDNSTLGTIGLTNKSISTSGDYQQYFMSKGKRYHHILDPKTGLPARECMSVTIITSDSCMDADILSTALFVIGYPKSMRFIENQEHVEAVIVDSKGKVHVTEGLRGRIKNLKNDTRY